jgi:hypothetical protein
MLYAVLIYGSEERVRAWTAAEEKEVMTRHAELRSELAAERRLGPVLRLTPTGAKTVRRYKDRRYVTDGPFAETKEQLMGIYVVDCMTFDDAVAVAERLDFETGTFEIQPVPWLDPGVVPPQMPPPP